MAVFLKLNKEEISKLVKEYNLDLIRYEGIIQGVQNTNYFIETQQGKYILTICEPEIDPDDLPFFNSAMLHAFNQKLPVPMPLQTTQGKFTTIIKGKPAGIATFLEGTQAEELTLPKIRKLGEFLGSFHKNMRSFTSIRNNPVAFGPVKDLIFKNEKIDTLELGLATEVKNELDFVGHHLPHDLPAGFIHADVFPDNVFFNGDEVSGLIDFYFSATDFFAYDLAVVANAWCFDENGFVLNHDKLQTLLDAYNSVRLLEQAETQAFYMLCRRAALRFFATRAWDKLYPKSNAEVGVKDPMEYVAKMRTWQQL